MKKLSIILFSLTLFSFAIISDIETNIPQKNSEFISFLEKHGREIAPSYQKRNCTEFMAEALNRFISITPQTTKRIHIPYTIDKVESLLHKNDSMIISGVCGALVASKQAIWIPENAVKRGDIVQYWSEDGFLNGHCGIVYSKDKDGYIIYSSHQDSKGFGLMNVKNSHLNKIKFYFVRLK